MKTCILGAFTALITVMTAVSSSAQTSGDRHTREIVRRAYSMADSIPTQSVRDLLKVALGDISIIHADSMGYLSFAKDRTFFLALCRDDQMPQLHPDRPRTAHTLTAFSQTGFDNEGRITVLINEDIGAYCSDTDIQATCLLQSLANGLQATVWKQRGKTMKELDFATFLQNQTEVWDLQSTVYFKFHPEYLTGIRCDCNSFKIFCTNEDAYQRLSPYGIENPMAEKLVLYRSCGTPFLKKLYPAQ